MAQIYPIPFVGWGLPRLAAFGAPLAALFLSACAPDRSPTFAPEEQAPMVPATPEPGDEEDRRLSQAEIRQKRAEDARIANARARNAPDQISASRAELYRSMEMRLVSQGLLREETDPRDARFNADMLAKNFIDIALHDEYGENGKSTAAPLRRWRNPVWLQLDFGKSVSLPEQRRLRVDIGNFAKKLENTTGHPFGLTARGGNFLVLVVSETERRQIGDRIQKLMPGIPKRDLAAIENLSPQNYCTVFGYSRGQSASYVSAVAVLRAELPDRMMQACIHEELAQGMGLTNDSPDARPSIFNDDREFARLTKHDELLLEMLYDPRLRPGMQEAQATPIVKEIADEIIR